MNPFKERAMPIDASFRNWSGIYPKPYCKHEVDPYTKCRIILMNGAEFESVNFGHRFHRICNNNDLRRELALIRRQNCQYLVGFLVFGLPKYEGLSGKKHGM